VGVLRPRVDGVATAGALGRVHRDVGLAQQAGRVRSMHGIGCDADARSHEEHMPRQRERLAERMQERTRGLDRTGRIGGRQQHRKLVAAQTGHGVGGADRILEPAT